MFASPNGGSSNPLAHVSTDASLDSPMSSRLSTDSGRSGSPTAMRDMALHGSVRIDLPNMGEKRGLMAKGRAAAAAAGGSALPLLLRGSSGRALLPPPPGRVLCRDVSGAGQRESDDDDAQARGYSAPGSARSWSSVDMDSTPTATNRTGGAATASPPVVAGSTGASSGVMETSVSMTASVAASAGDTAAADEDFGDFCEAQE